VYWLLTWMMPMKYWNVSLLVPDLEHVCHTS
jgi:hypothetical protein